MKKHIIYIVLALATIASCQKESIIELSPSTTSQGLIVSLPTDDDSASRVTLTNGSSSVDLNWDSDDKFTIYTTSGERVADYLYSTVSSGKTLFLPEDGDSSLSDNVEYIAIYPSVDDATNLEEHRAALAARVSEQTQTGDNDNAHLDYALRMEAEFTYSDSSDTNVHFEYQVATMRIAFSTTNDVIPTKVIFNDGDKKSYTLNIEEATASGSYTANFVMEPHAVGESRKLELMIYVNDSEYAKDIFSINSEISYIAGVQYRSTLAVSDITKYIYTKEDLIEFSSIVNNGESNLNAVLMSDIDLDGEEWTPIGSGGNNYDSISYSGIFDGGGFIIRNLSIDSGVYQGLFGRVVNGSISNVLLLNPDIQAAAEAGGICRLLYNSSISNCGVVGGSITVDGGYAGGVVGRANNSFITGCFNSADISITSSGLINSVGGVVGEVSSSSVIACYNTGCISGNHSGGGLGVGGIIGVVHDGYDDDSSFSIVACYNLGNVYGSVNGGLLCISGLIGKYESIDNGPNITIAMCYTMGDISGFRSAGGLYLCSIIGYDTNISTISNIAIENCYYLYSSDYKIINGTADANLESTMTASSFPATLNDAAGDDYFEFDTNNYNSGYPILSTIDYTTIEN